MHSPDWQAGFPGVETSNVSLYRTDPAAMGMEFAPHTARIALRVADVEAARRELEARGVSFVSEHDTEVRKMAFFGDSQGNSLMLHRPHAC